jgi:hypothetical protein
MDTEVAQMLIEVELGIDRERCLDLVMSQIGEGESRDIRRLSLLEVDNDTVFAAMVWSVGLTSCVPRSGATRSR